MCLSLSKPFRPLYASLASFAELQMTFRGGGGEGVKGLQVQDASGYQKAGASKALECLLKELQLLRPPALKIFQFKS